MQRHILIADDDPVLREIVGEHLQQAGYAVTLAEDGAQALKKAAATPFDLVITDLFMPNMDGIELIIAVKRERPALPVIAISGGAAGMDADLLLRAATAVGAISVLAKPLMGEVLIEEVRTALAS